MWWFKAIAAASGLMLLAGCGFQPLYAERSQPVEVSAEMARIAVAPIADRAGQQLQNLLAERLNSAARTGPAEYVLQVSLTEEETELLTARDATATRSRIAVRASYILLRDGLELDRQVIENAGTYNWVQSNQFSTVIAARDARSRALQQIAEEIRIRLGLYFLRQAEQQQQQPSS
ncbi:LPS assembly lipoprotein LptE [Telmatospirillum sp. J64-1]|uniref:LPS assembly lipoprotein LptE n=1 Tax=Telmatospirillum sp. J64-1 TaxID=2502183 RepID=UPI00115EE1F0|nr:LPS assembly lipoprotein LptE [Telmatospirillum sp. J64-1]